MADLGGAPAIVSGTVALTAGSVVYLVVGQPPTYNDTQYYPFPFIPGSGGGGGGGTYVFLGDLATPLLVAGIVCLTALHYWRCVQNVEPTGSLL